MKKSNSFAAMGAAQHSIIQSIAFWPAFQDECAKKHHDICHGAGG
ncbi:MAG: hypothetical protein PUD16_03930 [bacterium]|nr:hypothetical protein [bacterium]